MVFAGYGELALLVGNFNCRSSFAKGFTYVCDKSGKGAIGLWYSQGMVNLPCFWLQKKLHFVQNVSYMFIKNILYFINNIKIFYIFNNQAILNIKLKFKIKYFKF